MALSGGSNQSRVRDHNERLVLTLVRQHQSIAKSDLARSSGLSAQTISVIMRSLEEENLLLRLEPVRGKVGQPSVPMTLNPDAVFSIGLSVGRRSAELVLLDFAGNTRRLLETTYLYPMPEPVLDFVHDGLAKFDQDLGGNLRALLCGLGVAIPHELWRWAEEINAPVGAMDSWRTFSFQSALSASLDCPVIVCKDTNAACAAELLFGSGPVVNDFAYFFLGAFIGGGIVLNQSVFNGLSGNGGALGSIPVLSANSAAPDSLIDRASIYLLEKKLADGNNKPERMCAPVFDWTTLPGDELQIWLVEAAQSLAVAINAIVAVIDFNTIIIDGTISSEVRQALVDETTKALENRDMKGVTTPEVRCGTIGHYARSSGAATLPITARYLIDQNVLFNEPT